MATAIKRTYMNFTGVDFLNEPSLVSITRSPDALNVWKNYKDTEGTCIETRPGYRKIAQIGSKINGMYLYSSTKAIVHSGTKLYEWNNFPSVTSIEDVQEIYTDMNNNIKSSFNMFKGKLYINDGKHYLVFDGQKVSEVKENAIVPTTSIGRKAGNIGGGESFQDINLLQPKRTNSFLGNGEDNKFYLDAQNIDSTKIIAIVNDIELQEETDFTVDRVKGIVTFNEIPSKDLLGADNVFITFSKTIEGYDDRINQCTKSIIFDNRLFFTGNPNYPNVVFHSELNEPSYVSDLSYYEAGSSNSKITGMCIGNNILWLFKNLDQNNANVFYLEPTLDLEHGKIYPIKQGNVSLGCYVDSINFQDDIVYLSRYGLEGITTEKIDSKQVIAHRSSMIDSKMINENNYENAYMEEFKGYLLILVNGKIFLADSRQKFANMGSFEYEWFYWDISDSLPNILKEYNDKLFIGANDGSIFVLEGTNDNNGTIKSYWTTLMDNFGYSNQTKTTNKRGGIAKIKTIPNGIVKVAKRSDKSDEYKYVTQKSATGFSFNQLNFLNFSFVTSNKSYIVYKIKEKKFNEISLKFYSDERDKPFGIYSTVIEAFIGGYVKK